MFGLNSMREVVDAAENNVVTTTVTAGDTRGEPQPTSNTGRNPAPLRQQPAQNLQQPQYFQRPRTPRAPSPQTQTNIFVTQAAAESNSPRRPSYEPSYNPTARSVDNLVWTIAENERRRAAQEARDREYSRLHGRRNPVEGEIRYIAREGFFGAPRNRPNLQPIIDFSRRLNRNRNYALPSGNGEFWQQINGCHTEQESRDVILEFKVEIERMINDSDLTPEYKQRFHEALNTHTRANDINGVTAVLGVLTAVICISLLAQASIGGYLAATAVGGLFALYASSSLNNQNSNPTKYFPRDRGAICEERPFRNWVANLNNVAYQADENPNRAFNNRPQPQY